MTGLAAFKEQHPAYADVPDRELADALYQKFYSGVDRAEFDKRIGLAEPWQPPPEPDFSAYPDVSPDQYGDGAPVDPVVERRQYQDGYATGAEATGQAVRNVPARLGASVGGLGMAAGEALEEVSEGEPRLNPPVGMLGTLYRLTPQGAVDTVAGVIGSLPDEERNGVATALSEYGAELAEHGRLYREERKREIYPTGAKPGSAADYVSQGVGASLEMVPALAASVVVRNPAPVMAWMGAYAGGAAYGEARDKGLEPGIARDYASLQAIAEGVGDSVPVARMLRPGKGFLKSMGDAAATNAVEEVITEALQIGIDSGYINPDMTWGEARQRLVDAGAVGAISGPMMAGFVRGSQLVVDPAVQKVMAAMVPPQQQVAPEMPSMTDMIVEQAARLGLDPAEVARGLVGPDAPAQPQAPSMTDMIVEQAARLGLDPAEVARGLVGPDAPAQPQAPSMPGGGGKPALDIIRHFEGFRETPYWDVNAYRTGFGSDTVTLPDGTVKRVEPGMKVSVEDAERDLARRAAEFENGARAKVGPWAWDNLPDYVQAALTSVAYNYGSIPNRLVGAIRSGDSNMIASAVGGLAGDNGGVNARRRRKEAAVIRTGDLSAVSGYSTATGGGQGGPEMAQDGAEAFPGAEVFDSDEASPAPAPERRDGPEVPADVEMLAPSEIEADPDRFQFKSGGDAAGVTQQLQGVRKWNPDFAGVSVVWEDSGGQRFIVDGHQRLGLAKRLEAEGQEPRLRSLVLRESDGVTAEQARFYGAMKNLAEGGESTSAVDVARVLRAGGSQEAVAEMIPPRRRAYQDGQALARLGDDAWGMVINEVVEPQMAAEVGRQIEDPAQQAAAMGYLGKVKPRNVNQARLIVQQVRDAGFSEATQEGLFGPEQFAETLIAERAKILDGAGAYLRQRGRAFKTVINAADVLAEAGNVLDVDASAQKMDENQRLSLALERLAQRKGPISDALNEQARAVKEGRATVAQARQGFLEAVRDLEPGAAGIPGAERGEAGEGPGTDQEEARPAETVEAPAQPEAAQSAAPQRTGTKEGGTIDQTPEGDQRVIPGTERITDREQAERKQQQPKRGGDAAPPEGGLFDEGAQSQQELFSEVPGVANAGALQPMPGWRPGYSSGLPMPARPAGNVIQVAGRDVTIPKDPLREETIRVKVSGMIGPRLYAGKIKGKSRAGFYRTQNGEMRIRRFNDIETIAHEVAHWLDFHKTHDGAWQALRKNPPDKSELHDLSYTSDKDKLGVEGFAEYVRLWLTQYAEAKASAPKFTAAFEAELAKHPKLAKQMRRIQDDMHAWFAQGPAMQARSKIGRDESFRTRITRWLQSSPVARWRQQLIARSHGFKVAERETTGRIADADASAYKQLRLSNGWHGAYEAAVRWGSLKVEKDGSIGFRGKGLADVLKPVMGSPRMWDDFWLYAAGRRAAELKEQGRENLFNGNEIGAMLNVERPGFKEVFAELQVFNSEMLDFYVDMNLITKDQRKAFEETNKNYIPFHRVREGIDGIEEGWGQTLGRRLTGGTENVKEISDNVAEGLAANVRAAFLARAKSTLYRTLTRTDDGAKFAAPLPTDSKKVKVYTDDLADTVARVMAQNGLTIANGNMIVAGDPAADKVTQVEDIKKALNDNPGLLQFWNHGIRPETKGTLVDSAIIDGEVKYFEVRDPVLAGTLMAFRMRQFNAATRAAMIVRKALSRTITSMPQFIGGNAFRDTMTAMIQSDSGFRPFYDSLRGAADAVKRSDTYKLWKANGGGYGDLVSAVTESGREQGRLGLPARNGFDKMYRSVLLIDEVSRLAEEATRLGEFRRALAKGKTATEAAFRSREITTDFGERPGSVGVDSMLQWILFANAGLQGIDRTIRYVVGEDGRFNKKLPLRVATSLIVKSGLSLAAFTAALWLMNHDEDWYKDLTKDEKGRFWWYKLPWMEKPATIPKPYGFGFIFADTVENALDYVSGAEGKDVAENLAWSLHRSFWFLQFPVGINYIWERGTNETWTGSPVVPENISNPENPHLEYDMQTPEAFRQMADTKFGRSVGMSPLAAEHFVRSHTGYLYYAFADLTELMLWDKESWGERPFVRSPDEYITHQFKTAKVDYRTRWQERYYDLRNRADAARRAMSRLTAQAVRDAQGPARFAEGEVNRALIALDRGFNQIDSVLSDVSKANEMIYFNPKLSREEKEARIKKNYESRNALFRDAARSAEGALAKIEERMER